jgi:hypothetical protein
MNRRFLFLLLLSTFASCTHQESRVENNHSSGLPSLHIDLKPEELDLVLNDPDYEAPAQVLFLSAENDTLFEGELDHIKTRGNSTFEYVKKPFTIKFPMKLRILGLDKSRSFVLLANVLDDSHIRNAIAFDLAHAVGLPAPQYAYLSLYINGEYKGLYQMTNKVEVSKHALNITDLDKLNKQANPRPLSEYTWFGYGRRNKQTVLRKGILLEHDPMDITGGYLLDNSGHYSIYNKGISGFVSDAGDPIRIRSPKYASPNEVNYIATIYNQMETAILAEDGYNPQTGKHYSEYIDMESFALYYLLNELLLNEDGGFASFYIYKDSDSIDSKFYAGPIWDFDKSLKTVIEKPEVLVYNEIYVAAEMKDFYYSHSGGFFYYLCQHKDFQQIIKNIYYQSISPYCHNYLESCRIDSLIVFLENEVEKDNRLFGKQKNADFLAVSNKIKYFLTKRLEFFDWFFSMSQDDMTCVDYQIINDNSHKIMLKMYYPIKTPIHAPSCFSPYITMYNHAPVSVLYIAGTDSIVPDGTIFHSAQNLELRFRQPTWREVQARRIRKKLAKWGFYNYDDIE